METTANNPINLLQVCHLRSCCYDRGLSRHIHRPPVSAIPKNKRNANKGVADLNSPQATLPQPPKLTEWEIPLPPLPLLGAQLPLATPPPTSLKGTQAEHVMPPGKKRKKTLEELMKVIEESDEDDYVTESELVKGIECYSTNHPRETIVDQLY